MKKLLLISLLLIAVVSCSRKMFPTQTIQREVIKTQTITDTVVKEAIDSAWLSMLLECDSLGQVKLKSMSSKMSALMSSNFNLENNVLRLESTIYSLKKERTNIRTDTVKVIQKIEIPTPYPVTKKERFIPWWASWLSWIGGFYLLRIIIKLATNWSGLTLTKIFKLL